MSWEPVVLCTNEVFAIMSAFDNTRMASELLADATPENGTLKNTASQPRTFPETSELLQIKLESLFQADLWQPVCASLARALASSILRPLPLKNWL